MEGKLPPASRDVEPKPPIRLAAGLRKAHLIADMTRSLLTALFLTAAFQSATAELAEKSELYTGKEYTNAFAMPEDDPALPDVLLIGDSISIGYTVDVRKLLKGKADVFRIPGNGQDSDFGVENLGKWLGERKWEVIHFNWGLWDICYRHPDSKQPGHRDKVNGKLSVTPEQYRENLEKIVARLKETGAELIWCATTPVPEGEVGRRVGDEIAYNRIAAEIMEKHGVATNDLHAHALEKLPGIAVKKGDVHFTAEGCAHLAEKVAESVSAHLKPIDKISPQP
jgi:hypothetical protein